MKKSDKYQGLTQPLRMRRDYGGSREELEKEEGSGGGEAPSGSRKGPGLKPLSLMLREARRRLE